MQLNVCSVVCSFVLLQKLDDLFWKNYLLVDVCTDGFTELVQNLLVGFTLRNDGRKLFFDWVPLLFVLCCRCLFYNFAGLLQIFGGIFLEFFDKHFLDEFKFFIHLSPSNFYLVCIFNLVVSERVFELWRSFGSWWVTDHVRVVGEYYRLLTTLGDH